jgi:hypothetical protein
MDTDAVQYVIATSQAFWVVTCTAAPGQISRSVPVFDRIVQSLKIQ